MIIIIAIIVVVADDISGHKELGFQVVLFEYFCEVEVILVNKTKFFGGFVSKKARFYLAIQLNFDGK